MESIPLCDTLSKPVPATSPLADRVRGLCSFAASEGLAVHVWFPISAELVPIGGHAKAPTDLLWQELACREEDVFEFAARLVAHDDLHPLELLAGRRYKWDPAGEVWFVVQQASLELIARIAAARLRSPRGLQLRRRQANAIATALEGLLQRSRQTARNPR